MSMVHVVAPIIFVAILQQNVVLDAPQIAMRRLSVDNMAPLDSNIVRLTYAVHYLGQ